MTAKLQLIQAIGVEFIDRKLRPIIVIYSGLSLLVIGLLVWLASNNAWWWVLAGPAIFVGLMGLVVLVVAWRLFGRWRPALTTSQSTAVKDFVDKLERVTENFQTPMFVIVFRVIRDTVRPRGRTFVQTVAEDSTTLESDLKQLLRDFQQKSRNRKPGP